MGVLSGLEPKSVFRFFEELRAIPHGSHNTKRISDYIVTFAEARHLKFRQDELNNVIIWKAPTAGYEHAPTVMLQGHMDMVAEKDADCPKDPRGRIRPAFTPGGQGLRGGGHAQDGVPGA